MTADGAAADYELTVRGPLGPVLRRALSPGRVVESRTCTTLLAVSARGLESVVAMADASGLRIEEVCVAASGPVPDPGHDDAG